MSEKRVKEIRQDILNPNGHDTTTDAKRTLIKDAKIRQDKCRLEIAQVLKRHNCRFEYYMILRGGRNPIAQGSIVSNE